MSVTDIVRQLAKLEGIEVQVVIRRAPHFTSLDPIHASMRGILSYAQGDIWRISNSEKDDFMQFDSADVSFMTASKAVMGETVINLIWQEWQEDN